MKLKEAFTEADVPGVGEVDTTNPVDWGKLVVGVAVLTLGFSAGSFVADEAKSLTGTADIQNPLENTLGDF